MAFPVSHENASGLSVAGGVRVLGDDLEALSLAVLCLGPKHVRAVLFLIDRRGSGVSRFS